MEHKVPDWIDKDLLTNCLRNEYKTSNIEITKCSASPAIPPGNGYGGCVTRVSLEYVCGEDADEKKFLSLIIKSKRTEGPVQEMMQHIQSIEGTFYSKFCPLACRICELSCIPKYFTYPDPSLIILEDLKEQGFIPPDRFTQLDFDHCRLYMVAAASLHAVSVAVHKEHPKLIKQMGEEKIFVMKSKFSNTLRIMCKYGMKCMVEAMEKVGRYKKPCQILKAKSSDTIWDMILDALRPGKLINVVNQGDPWTCNMMFKYDDNGFVSEVKLLDFQMVKYGSPASDLTLFIWSSANSDVRRNRLEELYHIYLQTFNDKLQEIGCSDNMSSYETFKEEIKRFSPMALAVNWIFYPTFHHPAAIDFTSFISANEDLTNDQNPYEIYVDEYYHDVYLPSVVEQLEFAGIFDYIEKYNNVRK